MAIPRGELSTRSRGNPSSFDNTRVMNVALILLLLEVQLKNPILVRVNDESYFEDYGMNSEKLDELKFALAAYDGANSHAMRLWYAASLVSAVILAAENGLHIPSVLITQVPSYKDGLPILVIALAALNLVFVVAQISHYRMAKIYQSMVEQTFSRGEIVSKDFSWRDLALSAPIAGYNRSGQLLSQFGLKEDWTSRRILKFSLDSFFGIFPAIGIFFGLLSIDLNSWLHALFIFFGMVSIFATTPILTEAYKYAFRK